MGIKSFFKRENNEKSKRPPYGFVLNPRGIYDYVSGYTSLS